MLVSEEMERWFARQIREGLPAKEKCCRVSHGSEARRQGGGVVGHDVLSGGNFNAPWCLKCLRSVE